MASPPTSNPDVGCSSRVALSPRRVHRVVALADRGRDLADRHGVGVEGSRAGDARIGRAARRPGHVRTGWVQAIGLHVDRRGPGPRYLITSREAAPMLTTRRRCTRGLTF